MSLETRVDTLERDIALLRAETRGWAAIAVVADRKSDMNAELLNLIYREVLEIKHEHGEILRGHTATLNEQGEILRGHTATLNEHGEILRGHGEILRGHGDMLRGHGDMLREHGDMLREHGEMLREILARLP